MPEKTDKVHDLTFWRERYAVAICVLRALAAKPDFTDEGERVFFDLFKECKALNSRIVDLEVAGW